MRLVRRNHCLLAGGLLVLGLIYGAFQRFSTGSSPSGISELSLKKKDLTASSTVASTTLAKGRLVCLPKKDEHKETVRESSTTNRPIGCCPVGAQTGTPYKKGSSCCVKTVYNATTQFCCTSKSRVLKNTPEEHKFCDLTICRKKDLQVKSPMTVRCSNDSKTGTPSRCQFKCIDGTKPKGGVKDAKCESNGVWSRKPICCEGCKTSYTLDLWLIVEVNQTVASPVRRFLKDMLAYFPISQKRVRVGITTFNKEVISEGVWDLSAHDSSTALIDAIYDKLTFEGSGSALGKALSWVAKNAFTSERGNRGVPNQVVVVLYGKPEDEYTQASKDLKATASVVAVTVGNAISDEALKVIAPDGFVRSPEFSSLSSFNQTLYHRLCGVGNCVKTAE